MPITQKGGFTVIIIILIALVAMAGAGFYFGSSYKVSVSHQESETEKITSINKPSILPVTSAPTPVSSPQKSNFPAGWRYQKSAVCNVAFPVPPKAEPYTTSSFPPGGAADDNNRYWKLNEANESELFFFRDDAILSFIPVDNNSLGNDYNPGSVSVFCTANPDNLSSNQIVSKLENEIKVTAPDFNIIKKGDVNKWELNTTVVNIEGGMGGEIDSYIFSVNGKMYLVEAVSNSSNQIVKDTTKQIFDNLKFSN